MTEVNAIQSNESEELKLWNPLFQQQLFRLLITAFSYPGRCISLTQEHAFLAVLATLVDAEVTLADPDRLLSDLSRTRLSARTAAPEKADFILALGSRRPEFVPSLGSLGSPEQGATIVVLVPSLESGERWQLTGPGVKDRIVIRGISKDWVDARNSWCGGYPTGVDLLLTDGRRLMAIPRTTHIHEAGE